MNIVPHSLSYNNSEDRKETEIYHSFKESVQSTGSADNSSNHISDNSNQINFKGGNNTNYN